MKSNITRKRRHKNTPTKQLISTVIARYAAASVRERTSIVNFFNWAIKNTGEGDLQNFHVEVRSRILEVTER